jgi:hypothetical protein
LGPANARTAFGAIFQKHFSGERIEPSASFRLRLLKFSALLSRRTVPGTSADFSPILDSVRTSHGRRTAHFSSARSPCPLHRSYLQQLPIGVEYRRHYVEMLRENGSMEVRPALIDLQPLFFKLTAYQGALEAGDSCLKRDWMNLAGQFMLQSAVEQLLIYKTRDPEVLKEAFSWTWKADKNADELDAQSEEEVAEWEHVRACWAAAVSRLLILVSPVLIRDSSIRRRGQRACHTTFSALKRNILSINLKHS